MPTPHRIVDGLLDGLADGVAGFIGDVGNTAKGVGQKVKNALDKPPQELGGPEGIHHIPDRVLNGTVDAAVNWPTKGAIDSLKIYGEGISRGLDQPEEQFGIPPKDIGMGGRFPKPFKR